MKALLMYIGGLVVVLFVGYFLLEGGSPSAQSTAAPVASVPAVAPRGFEPLRTVSPKTVPGADNVSHTFRVRTETLRRRIEATPTDTTALLELAHLLDDAHQTEAAVQHYTRYLQVRRDAPQVWLDLTNCYARLEQWDAAAAASHSLLAIRPEHPAAMYNLGAIYANQRALEEARTWWQRVAAQQQDPALALKATHSLLQLQK